MEKKCKQQTYWLGKVCAKLIPPTGFIIHISYRQKLLILYNIKECLCYIYNKMQNIIKTANIRVLQAICKYRLESTFFAIEAKKTMTIPISIAIIFSFISDITYSIFLSAWLSLYFNNALEQADIAEKFRENIANVNGKEYLRIESMSLGAKQFTKTAITKPPKIQNEIIYILFISIHPMSLLVLKNTMDLPHNPIPLYRLA